MGTGKNDSMHGANVSGSEFVKSTPKKTQRNDLSNPQQGTGVAKTTTSEKRDNGPKKNYDQNAVSAKSSVTNQANHFEDKRKLFVGGLPTDITDPEFRHFFSQFGELHEAAVMFDKVTGRSRGFGFVTYVNPAVSQSLLQMGNNGDGIGRLVMRGKTCEVKAAAPRGQAPTRGGKSYRNNRSGLRHQHQRQTPQFPSFGQFEQFPAVHQNGTYNLPYAQGMYSVVPGVPGYAPPIFHTPMPHPSHSQPHSLADGTIAPGTDRKLGESNVVGPTYFFGSSLPTTPPDHVPAHGAFPFTPHISGHYQHQGFGFVPYIPDNGHSVFPMMTMPTMNQPMEMSLNANKDEIDSSHEGETEVHKDCS